MKTQKATCGSNKKLTVSPYFLRAAGHASVYIIVWCVSDSSNLLRSCYSARIIPLCVGARAKLNVRGCPLCFVLYFYPAAFNVIISPVISIQWKTHPARNNTPLSIRGTGTHTHTVHYKDTYCKSVIWNQSGGFAVGPVAFHSLYILESRLRLDSHWSQPGRSDRHSLVHWCRCSGSGKAKDKRPFVRDGPVLTWEIAQSKDVASVRQVNLTNWWMTKKEPVCYFNCFLTSSLLESEKRIWRQFDVKWRCIKLEAFSLLCIFLDFPF